MSRYQLTPATDRLKSSITTPARSGVILLDIYDPVLYFVFILSGSSDAATASQPAVTTLHPQRELVYH
jgi:hypothetical protein